jgi:hypothetical protein
MRTARNFSNLVLLVALFGALAHGQAVVTDDANTSSFSPKSNYGGSIALLVCSGSNTYIKFSLADFGTGITGSNVSKATLIIYVDAVLTSGTMDVYQVKGSWSEGTITYNNAPALGTKLFSAVSVTSPGYLSLDMTSTVQAWLNGTLANNGIALVPSSGSPISFSFDSKENLFTSHTAQLPLVLVSAGSQGPQGPQGPAGPQGSQGPQGPAGQQGPQGSQGLQGAQGQQGIPGLTGATGATGATGQQGPAGANGVGFTFRNAFDNSASYLVNDVVSYNGSSYVAIAANQPPNNPTPDQNSAWSLMAQSGAPGAAGATGSQGPIGAPGAAGAQGPAGPQGSQGPQGLQGAQGTQGPQGVPGNPGPAGVSVMAFTEPAGANCSGGGVKLVAVNATTYVCNGASSGTTFFTISGTLSGLAAATSVTLLDNGTDQITLGANGSFTFPTPLATGASYTVTVLTQPTSGTCTVGNGTGTVGTSGVSSVTVSCSVPVVVTTLASSQDHPSGIAVDGTNVYWANLPPSLGGAPGTEYIPLGGGSVTSAANGSGPIALDLNNIYLITGGTLYRIAKGSLNATTIASQLSGGSLYAPFFPVFGLAVDAQNAYFINNSGVWTAPLGGSNVTPTLFANPGTAAQVFAIAVDGNNVYWTVTGPGVGSVMMLAKTGGTARIIASGLNFPSSIAVDATNVYWTNNGGGTVMMAPIAGGSATTVASGQSFPFGIAVDSENIYWTNNGTSSGGTVMKVPITGGTPTAIASGQNFPMGIALDQTNVYWTNNAGPAAPVGASATGTVVKATK